MRTLLNIIGFLAVLCIICTGILNADTPLSLNLWKAGMQNTNFAIYTLIVLFTGLFTGILWVGQFYFTQKEKLNAYKRELEKSSITNSSSTSRVEVLEAKIATLEKALNDALNK